MSDKIGNPVHGMVVVQKDENSSSISLKNGLIVFEKQKTCTVKVVAVSEDETDLVVGDIVALPQDCGMLIEIDGEDYLLVGTHEILYIYGQ